MSENRLVSLSLFHFQTAFNGGLCAPMAVKAAVRFELYGMARVNVEFRMSDMKANSKPAVVLCGFVMLSARVNKRVGRVSYAKGLHLAKG